MILAINLVGIFSIIKFNSVFYIHYFINLIFDIKLSHYIYESILEIPLKENLIQFFNNKS